MSENDATSLLHTGTEDAARYPKCWPFQFRVILPSSLHLVPWIRVAAGFRRGQALVDQNLCPHGDVDPAATESSGPLWD